MKNAIFLILMVCSLYTKSQLIESHKLYNKIVLIRDYQGTKELSATGFILTDNNVYFLVTAKHVADKINLKTTCLFFGDTTMIATRVKLKDFFVTGMLSGSNDKSDGYILKLEPFDKTSERLLKNSSLNVNMLSDTRKSIARNVDLLVMGYPIADLDNFAPITFKSYFSSSLMIVQVDIISRPTASYLLENPCMEGCSGAPVFISVKDRSTMLLDKTYIAGLVSGVTGDHTGAKYSVITPSYMLLDLIYGR